MSGPYLEGERALERLGDLTELICRVAEKKGLDRENRALMDEIIGEMGEALTERDLVRAKKLVTRLLSEVLGYDTSRAGFVMNNHLNKNAGWD
ncbi:MAG: hypothetical protein RIG61_02160 [Deltaproteobacteria bacterium]